MVDTLNYMSRQPSRIARLFRPYTARLATVLALIFVGQETYLFHATVRENLRFAAPEAGDAEVEAAARAARIHDLIA